MLALGQAVSCARARRYLGSDFAPGSRSFRGRCRTAKKFGRPVRFASKHCHEKESPLLAHKKRIPVKSGLGYLPFSERAFDCESDAPSARRLSLRMRASASLAHTRFGKLCLRQKRARPRPNRRLRARMAACGSAVLLSDRELIIRVVGRLSSYGALRWRAQDAIASRIGRCL
jgi:hypothetical protein